MILAFVCLLIGAAVALPDGAPSKVCESMTPLHGNTAPQRDLAPFGVYPHRRDGDIWVSISSTLGLPFQGFMLQARSPDRRILGMFEVGSHSAAQTLRCVQADDAVTHINPQTKDIVEVVWRPPYGYEGDVIFIATIAQSYNKYWVGVQSLPLRVDDSDDADDADDDFRPVRPIRPETSTPPLFVPQPGREASAADFDPFYTGCGVTKLCFGAPAGCLGRRNCKAAAAVTVSGDKYDFEMKAASNAAWVGVGLSEDSKMGDDSVVECVKRGNSVDAYMSWTSAPPGSYGAARLSNSKLGIQLLNGSAVDGALYCRVRRDVRTRVRGRTFDLAAEQYHLVLAAGSGANPNSVEFHDIVFLASGERRALSDVSELDAASRTLVRLHGALMLAAWLGTASVGILLARYYRKTWVGGSLCGKDLWFAWHRLLMVLTWALSVTGVVLIVVELQAWSAESNPHAITGSIVTTLCFLQPIGAYFRPHPGTPRRPIFNWLHWLGGNTAHIIAILTIFFAVKLTKADLPDFMYWIMAAYVVFHVAVHLVLSLMGYLSERSSERRINSFPMKEMGSGRSSAYVERHSDAPYSGFRKCLLALYIIVIIVIVLVLIVITLLAPIEQTWSNLRSTKSGE